MRYTLRVLSRLLGYPTAELQAAIDELRVALKREQAVTSSLLGELDALMETISNSDLLDAQAAYTDLFDGSRQLSLHLFEHVHGDGRERGQAMIDLGQLYIDHGFAIASNELPDYLPVFLEFASCLPADEARELLGQPAHVLVALEERLRQHASPYAAVFATLTVIAGARPDDAALEELRGRLAQSKSIDEEWEEAPVDFGKPTLDAKRATGVVASIRAAQRAVVSSLKN